MRECVYEIMATLFDEYKDANLPELLSLLAMCSGGSVAGKDRIEFFQSMIAVKTAEMVNKQLTGTAETIAKSANKIDEGVAKSTISAKSGLDDAARSVIAALRESSQTTTQSAQAIKAQIEGLTTNIAQAGKDLRSASEQSSRLSGRLNWLTGVLAICGLLTAGATGFQAYEAKRQADLLAKQIVAQDAVKLTPPFATATQSAPGKPDKIH